MAIDVYKTSDGKEFDERDYGGWVNAKNAAEQHQAELDRAGSSTKSTLTREQELQGQLREAQNEAEESRKEAAEFDDLYKKGDWKEIYKKKKVYFYGGKGARFHIAAFHLGKCDMEEALFTISYYAFYDLHNLRLELFRLLKQELEKKNKGAMTEADIMKKIGNPLRSRKASFQDDEKFISVVNAGIEAQKAGDNDYAAFLYLIAADAGNADAKQKYDILKNPNSEQAKAANEAEELFKKGLAADKANDDAKAFESFYKAAGMGHVEAQRELGKCYNSGCGVSKDKTVGWALLGIAAAQGDSGAVGRFRIELKNVPGKEAAVNDLVDQGITAYRAGDYAKAVVLWNIAADMGNASAMHSLGTCYATGNGVTKDFAKAIEWYKKAIANGDEDAKKNLALAETKLAEQRK